MADDVSFQLKRRSLLFTAKGPGPVGDQDYDPAGLGALLAAGALFQDHGESLGVGRLVALVREDSKGSRVLWLSHEKHSKNSQGPMVLLHRQLA